MFIKQTLEQIGISGKKADAYLAVLELGSGTTIDIAKKAGIKRTTCYDILLDLIKMGFVYESVKGKKRLFTGVDPEDAKEMIKRKEKMYEEILPYLQSIYNVRGVKPIIKFYEGKNGLREVYEDTLKYSSGEILAFASEDVVKVLGHEWAKNYINRRVKKKIKYRGIMPGTEILEKDFVAQDITHLRKSKLIDPKKYPFSIEINIYGNNKVAFMSSIEETGLIVEATEIHKTLKLIFELLWDNLKGN